MNFTCLPRRDLNHAIFGPFNDVPTSDPVAKPPDSVFLTLGFYFTKFLKPISCNPGQPQTQYVPEAALEFLILLPLRAEC